MNVYEDMKKCLICEREGYTFVEKHTPLCNNCVEGIPYEKYDKIVFSLKLAKLIEEQLFKDKAFMWGKDEKLKGLSSTLIRRGILQLLVDKANG